MDEGSARVTKASTRRSRAVAAAVFVVAATGVVLAVVAAGHSPSDRWVADFESVDAAVVAQDAARVQHDLALAAPGSVASLRFDGEIGRRDAARIVSHPSPSNERLRRAYETTLQQNWRMYAGCANALASSSVDLHAVTVQLESQLALLRREESRVNAVARAVAYAPVFSSL